MKTHLGVCLCLALAALALSLSNRPLAAQEPALVSTPQVEAVAQLAPEQLDQLLGPIALYPDALIALILPAATSPVDLVLASRFLKDGGDPAAADSHAWDESVKALAHYPDVLKWMDDNLTWTKQLGEAFLEQPAEVMKSIQRLRARARVSGVLADTPQQLVVPEDDYIRIVPAQPDVIYVPRYDPMVVFVDRPVYYSSEPFLTFGVGFSVGAWLVNDCDWRHREVWVVDRRWSWRDHRDWRQPVFPGQPNYVADPHRHPWAPPPNPYRPPSLAGRRHVDDAAPAPMPNAVAHTDTRAVRPPEPSNRPLPANRAAAAAAQTAASGQQVGPPPTPLRDRAARRDEASAPAADRRPGDYPAPTASQPATVAPSPAVSLPITRTAPVGPAPMNPAAAPPARQAISFPSSASPSRPAISFPPSAPPPAPTSAQPHATPPPPPPQQQQQPPPSSGPVDDKKKQAN